MGSNPILASKHIFSLGIAQSSRVLVLETRGRRSEACYPDQFNSAREDHGKSAETSSIEDSRVRPRHTRLCRSCAYVTYADKEVFRGLN